MRLLLFCIMSLLFLPSCSVLRNLNKYQSDSQFKKTETPNFQGEKGRTQWWYFDCFFEDGSVLVFLITPRQWWNENGAANPNKSLVYVSYMNAKGEVKSIDKTFDYNELSFNKNNIISPYFKISKSHKEKDRTYTISFNMPEFEGEAVIHSDSKAFSPLPTGSMGKFATRHILKLKGKGLAFRYAAHVPQGRIDCRLTINNKRLVLSGKAYHEQGCFTGSPDQMGKGWYWFHFVSSNVNIFGKPGDFLCLEKDGKRLVAGLSFKEYTITDKKYDGNHKEFATAATIKFAWKDHLFEITPVGDSTPLVIIPSSETSQIWSTSLQPSILKLTVAGKVFIEEGNLLLETCKMSD